MPNIADITVKKADGTTDVVFTAITPSAGDNSAAIFRSNSVGVSIAQRPSLAVTPSGKPGRRVVKTNFVYPVVDLVSGKVVDYITMKCESNAADTAADAVVAEAMAQASNLNASALIKSVRVIGYGPN